MSTVSARLDALDRRLFERIAGHRTPLLDRTLPRLTSSADHGLLWLGISAVLAATGRRRAAVRGLASLGLGSALANGPLKLAASRSRPLLDSVPSARQLGRQPSSSSFPSGHSTSAAAFAAGVALEEPRLATSIAVLAAGVAYGRVHTGVHYPGDVAAGVALGVASAMLVKRAWPAKPGLPAAVRTADDAPVLADGTGLVLVVNPGGGSAELLEEVRALLRKRLPGSEVVEAADDLEQDLRQAASRATVLGSMGGDGTISCAAGIALEHDVALAVFPGGTLNHFAGELGITCADDVIDALQAGAAVRVSVGSAARGEDGLHFLNTFAIGVYPELVKIRERYESRMGKWPAMALATARVLRDAKSVTLDVDGTRREVWTLFAGNGRYHPPGFAPSWRERMDDASIDVRIIDATAPFARTRLGLAALTGLLGRSRVYEERVVGRLDISADEPVRIARDGEVSDGPEAMTLRAAQRSLVVYRPPAVISR